MKKELETAMDTTLKTMFERVEDCIKDAMLLAPQNPNYKLAWEEANMLSAGIDKTLASWHVFTQTSQDSKGLRETLRCGFERNAKYKRRIAHEEELAHTPLL